MSPSRTSQSSTRTSTKSSNTAPPSPSTATRPAIRRSLSNDQYLQNAGRSRPNGHGLTVQLPPIPGSPYGTEVGTPPGTPKSQKSASSPVVNGKSILKSNSNPNGRANGSTTPTPKPGETRQQQPTTPTTPTTRNRSKSSSYVPHRSPPPQSLNAAVELISQSDTNSNNYTSSHSPNQRSTSDSGHGRPSASLAIDIPEVPRLKINGGLGTPTRTHIRIDVGSPTRDPWATMGKRDFPTSPQRTIPAVPPRKSSLGVVGKDISSPILNIGEL
jgi:hypothetical protein